MTLVKFNNRPVRKTIDSVFDELFNHFPATWNEAYPAANVHETKEAFHIEMAAPGLTREDLQVTVENDLLTISFDKKEETKTEEHRTIRREFSQRSFRRSFSLDEGVDAENIQAKYENGVLKLYLPKKEPAKSGNRQINIQ